MSRTHLKVRNPELKAELVDIYDEIDSVAGDAEAYADGVGDAIQGNTTSTIADVEASVASVSASAVAGTPVNAVAAKSTLTYTGVVIDAETITVGDDTYEFAADTAQSVAEGSIAVDVTASMTASSGTLTLATQPQANDTITIGTGAGDVTYTFVGSNPVAGEVDLGADAAEAQVNLVAAINGTDGVNTANPYATAAVFAANDSVITAIIAGTAGDAIATTSSLTAVGDGFAAVTLGGGADCSAANAILAVVAASAGGTEPVAITDGAGDTLVVTANVAGVDAESILTSTDCANGTFDVAHLDGGVDGTVALAGAIWFDATHIYVCTADNTVADANWVSAALA